jgi:hypothetical protein
VAREVQFYWDFGKGEWGDQGSWDIGFGLFRQHLYYRGWWSGLNCWRYPDASVGPRPGLRDGTPQSWPAGVDTKQLMGFGVVPRSARLALFNSQGILPTLWLATSDGNVYVWVINNLWNGGTASLLASLGYTAISAFGHASNYLSAMANTDVPAGGGIFNLATAAKLAGSPAGGILAVWNNVLVCAGIGGYPNQIRYSQPLDASGNYAWTDAASTTIAAGSNGQTLPQATINVASTAGFPSAGTILVQTSAGPQYVNYSGVTATTFTGCTGGTGTLLTGQAVTYNPAGVVPAGSLNVGDGYITGVWPQRTHCVITTTTGTYIWAGQPGVNDTIRPAAETDGPSFPQWGSLDGDGMLWYLAFPGVYPADTPRWFNGSRTGNIAYLHAERGSSQGGYQNIGDNLSDQVVPPAFAASRLSRRREEMILGDLRRAVTFHRGVWTQHEFGSLDGFGKGFAAYDAVDGIIYFCSQLAPGAGNFPRIDMLYTDALEPGYEGGAQPQRAGDRTNVPLSGSFTLPEWNGRAGEEVTVREVAVDFKKINTGGTLNNHIDCTVTALRQRDQAGGTASATLSWDEAPSAAGGTWGASTTQRKVFLFGDQGHGNAYQISFPVLRGVAIQKVVVTAEVEQLNL